ncbi:MAG: hypothetical protein AB7U18_16655 [Dehalococcoidia bacterium]
MRRATAGLWWSRPGCRAGFVVLDRGIVNATSEYDEAGATPEIYPSPTKTTAK